jgi:hypothetical protein
MGRDAGSITGWLTLPAALAAALFFGELNMATLKKHGGELGRIIKLTFAMAHMADGTILWNKPGNWAVWGTVKKDRDPVEVYARAAASAAERDRQFPASAAYRRELHRLAGLGKAWKLHTAIQYMPGDPDGVWSEACDGYGDNVHADLDEVSHLMRLYHARVMEWQASK